MAEVSLENTNALIQSYQLTNKLLRGRAILLGVLFLIIVGLLYTVHENNQKQYVYEDVIYHLEYLALTDSVEKKLDASFKEIIDRDGLGVFSVAQLEKLRNDLAKSNNKDRTPIYDLMVEYDKQIKALGVKTGDYSISALGISTSMSDWIYFSPIILLLLYHDLTVKILYRHS